MENGQMIQGVIAQSGDGIWAPDLRASYAASEVNKALRDQAVSSIFEIVVQQMIDQAHADAAVQHMYV